MNFEKNKLIFLTENHRKIIFLKFVSNVVSPYLCTPKN